MKVTRARKRAAITAVVLSVVLVLTTAGKCDSVSPCQVPGEKVHGGAPRADSQECKDMQERARQRLASQSPSPS